MTATMELVAPTRERLEHAKGFAEAPEVNQTTMRRAWRILPLVLSLYRQDKIDADCIQAYERFAEDWEVGNRSSFKIASYGERIGSASDIDDTAEIRKANAYRRARNALDSIGSPHARRALMMTVASRPADAISTMRPYTIEEIGRLCCGVNNKPQAIAAGMTTLRDALYQLRLHYDEG